MSRLRSLLPVAALLLAGMLGGCIIYPDHGYHHHGYYYGGGYGGGWRR